MKEIEFTYKDALVSWNEMENTAGTLSRYTEHLSDVVKEASKKKINYEEVESSINLPFDLEAQKSVMEVAERTRTNFLKYIIVVGIGGSNLGTKAVIDGLRGTVDSFLEANKETPKIIFVDTTSPKLLEGIHKILEENVEIPEEVIVNIISKSGTTTETIANFEIVYSFLKERFKGDDVVEKRVVVTTDYGSKLWKEASERGFELLTIPKNVGGRYSVFSMVGLFPLVLAGVNVEQLLEGARIMVGRCVKKDVSENPALASAVLVYLHNQKGVSINNTFFFNPHLESVGRWYRQLMGESIGKKYGVDGSEVNAGITPIVSIGSTDLHSMAQLYLGGPRDKFTTFIYAPGNSKEVVVPTGLVLPGLVEGIEGKELSGIMSAIFDGVKEAYKKNGLPSAEVILENINEYTLGQFLQFKMFEIMYLARLLGVNAFDQPNVEDYKKETKKILLENR